MLMILSGPKTPRFFTKFSKKHDAEKFLEKKIQEKEGKATFYMNLVKREMKEDEGDPLIRGARKRRHREIVRRNALAESKKADVLIVNPTHIAIAVRYRKDQDRAPRVLAKGKGVLAEAMREVARSSGIPIIQDIPLARLLFKKVKSGGTVPADTYKAVAAVLAVVYRMTQRPPTRPGEVQS